MNNLDYIITTVIALSAIVFVVIRIGEWIARRRILKKQIASGRSISSSEAFRLAKIGEGVFVENLSDALPGKWWYLAISDVSAIAQAYHDGKMVSLSSHDGPVLRVEERVPDLLADRIKANGLLVYPIAEADRCVLSTVDENKIRLFQFLRSSSDGRKSSLRSSPTS